jgi:hypothetical protein
MEGSAVLFFRRRRLAPTVLILTGLGDVALTWPAGRLHWPPNVATFAVLVAPGLVVASMLYLALSPRARRTFVLPGL